MNRLAKTLDMLSVSRVLGAVLVGWAIGIGLSLWLYLPGNSEVPDLSPLAAPTPRNIRLWLLSGFLLLAVGYSRRFFRQWESGRQKRLTGRIESSRAQLLGLTPFERAVDVVEEWGTGAWAALVQPSVSILNVALIPAAIGSILLFVIGGPSPTELHAGYWQAHLALTAGALPILIFVIELASVRNRPGPTIHVLIRESYVFPVLVLLLVSTVILASGAVSEAVALSLFGLGVVCLGYSYGRTLQLLFDDSLRTRKFKELVLADLRRNLRRNVDLRLGMSILKKELGRLGFRERLLPAPSQHDPRFTVVLAHKEGVVRDIHLDVLESLDRELAETDSGSSAEEATEAGVPSEENSVSVPPGVPIEFTCGLGSYLREGEPVAVIRRAWVKPDDLPRLETMIRGVFKIAPAKEVQEALRSDLTIIREELIEAIRTGSRTATTNAVELYQETVDALVEEMEGYGLSYDRDHAEAERTAVLSHVQWEPLEWIKRDLHQVFEELFACGPIWAVFSEVAYLPIRMAGTALTRRDQLIPVNLALPLLSIQYSLLPFLPEDRVRQRTLLRDRLTEWPLAFSRYQMAKAVREARSAEHIRYIEELAHGFLGYSSQLAKEAWDRRDHEMFELAVKRMRYLFWQESLGDEFEGYREWQVVRGLPDERRPDMSGFPVELFEAVEQTDESIKELQAVISWGLKAWILRAFAKDTELTPEDVKRWLAVVGGLKANPTRTLSNYQAALKQSTKRTLRWDWWVTEEEVDDVPIARRMDEDGHLDRLFVLESLKAASGTQTLPLEVYSQAADLKHRFSEQGSLRPTLQQLVEGRKMWDWCLPENLDEARDRVINLWDEYVRVEENRRRQEVIDAELDGSLVASFRDSIAADFIRHGQLRRTIERLAGIDFDQPTEDNAEKSKPRRFGLFRRVPKELFLDGEMGATEVRGRMYGRQMARETGVLYLEDLADELNVRAVEANLGEILREACSRLQRQGLGPSIFVIGSWRASRLIQEHDQFEPSTDGSEESQIGALSGCPVYEFRERHGESAKILVADLRQLGTVKRVRLDQDDDLAALTDSALHLRVEAIEEELARQWVKEKPDLIDTDQDEDDAIADILATARMELFTTARFEILNSGAGLLYSLRVD